MKILVRLIADNKNSFDLATTMYGTVKKEKNYIDMKHGVPTKHEYDEECELIEQHRTFEPDGKYNLLCRVFLLVFAFCLIMADLYFFWFMVSKYFQ